MQITDKIMISDSASRHVFECIRPKSKRPEGPLDENWMQTVPVEPIVVCSWCPNPAERTRLAMIANGGRAVSHGICAECQRRMEEQ
jgi:hypothetical protein